MKYELPQRTSPPILSISCQQKTRCKKSPLRTINPRSIHWVLAEIKLSSQRVNMLKLVCFFFKWLLYLRILFPKLRSITMTTQWARWRLKSPAYGLFNSIVCSCANERKHQSSASLAFVRGINRWIPRTNGQSRGKCFHLMTSSCALPCVNFF